ncbi:thioredoxin domain-containing protein [Salsuginibacillus kocurii]|uniref:thioredoxin domain-containing protein n=1 Tax=Salsuginibacillus kocurii TaxID=427078 RepID=UPI00036BE810|nr:thioredoxin domain-containing protein [Salsuginibacillus kocurii]
MTAQRANRLIHEASPYLQQHAYNPVDWFPWGEEAFQKAKNEGKGIFLSVGYSTCHWCHVFERESFEDEDTAELLNRHFVSIKVDREERPDIDSIYMTACQAMTGRGGWPLSVFMTPGQVPFYAGTYFPKEEKHGLPAFKSVIQQLAQVYQQEPERIEQTGGKIYDALQKALATEESRTLDPKLPERAFTALSRSYDPVNGGFSSAPKFPQPQHFQFLLRYFHHTGKPAGLSMTGHTLKMMAKGGIFDQLGGGFSRYSVDQYWLVPHFEKMLYDNGLLLHSYVEAYQVTGDPTFSATANKIIQYVLRDLKDTGGAFYGAEDADSEGVEGTFYVWTPEEIIAAVGEEDGSLFCDAYDITEEGNFEGKSIPHALLIDKNMLADKYGLTEEKVTEKLEDLKATLFRKREKRPRPHLDDKILTSWNGLMIGALAKAGRAFQDEGYTEAADEALSFIETNLYQGNRLMARHRNGHTAHRGFIEDHANLLWAYIELYKTKLQARFLQRAKTLATQMIALFWDDANGGFFLYGHDQEQLLVRPKETFDGAMPAGSNVAAVQLQELSQLTGDPAFEQYAKRTAEAAATSLQDYPHGHSHLMQSVLLEEMASIEVVVALPQHENPKEDPFIRDWQQGFYPHVRVLAKIEGDEELAEAAPFAADYAPKDNQATYYVCRHFTCDQPVTDPEYVWKKISEETG